MEDRRAEQLEALETLAEYNDRILKNIPILVKELRGERMDDTDKFLDGIIKAVNWEIEVLNATMEVLNDDKERISKDTVNEKIIALSDAIGSKDDAKLADAFEGLLPVLETLKNAVQEVLA